MFVYVPPTPPSPQAQELSRQIVEFVTLAREQNPELRAGDIRVAMQLAGRRLSPVGRPKAVLILMLAALVGVGVFLMVAQRTAPQLSVDWIAVAIGLIGILGVVALVLRRR